MLLIGGIVFTSTIIQTRIANRLANDLKQRCDCNLEIDKVSLKLGGGLALEGLHLDDHKANQLLIVNRVDAKVREINKLMRGDLDFTGFNIEGLKLNVNKYELDSLNSLDIFLNSLQNQNSSDPQPVEIIAKNLILQYAQISYTDYEIPSNNYSIDSLNVTLSDIDYKKDSFHLQVENVNWLSPTNGDFLNTISGSIAFNNETLKIDGIEGSYEGSNFSGELIVYELENIVEDLTNGDPQLDINLSSCRIYPGRLGLSEYFEHSFYSDISARITGTLNNLLIEDIRLENKFLNIDGMLIVQNILNPIKRNISGELETISLSTDQIIGIKLIDTKSVGNYGNFGDVISSGNFNYTNNRLEVNLSAETELGLVDISAFLDQKKSTDVISNQNAQVTLIVSDFNLGSLLNLNDELEINGLIELTSNDLNSDLSKISIGWQTEDLSIDFKSWEDQLLTTTGRISNDFAQFQLDFRSELIDLLGDFELGLAKDRKLARIDAVFNLKQLKQIGVPIEDPSSNVKGTFTSDISGKSWETLIGQIQMNNLLFENVVVPIPLEYVHISSIKDVRNSLSLDGGQQLNGQIIGEYELKSILPSLKYILARAFGFNDELHTSDSRFFFSLFIAGELVSSINPVSASSKDFSLSGFVDTEQLTLNCNLRMPYVRYNQVEVSGLDFELKNNLENHESKLTFNKLDLNAYRFRQFEITGKRIKGITEYTIDGRGEKDDYFDLQFFQGEDSEGRITYGFEQSHYKFLDTDWQLQATDDRKQLIELDTNMKSISIESLLLTSENKYMALKGYYTDTDNVSVQLEVENVKLENFVTTSKDFKSEGEVDLVIDYSTTRPANKLIANAEISDFHINDQFLGTAKLKVEQPSFQEFYSVALSLSKAGSIEVEAQGKYWSGETSEVELNIDFDDFSLFFLNRVANPSLDQIKGKVTGSVVLSGPLNELRHQGKLVVQDAGLSVPYLNIDYITDDLQVDLIGESFVFTPNVFTDLAYDTQLVASGRIFHNRFKKWQLDLEFSSNRMLVIDKKEDSEELFYGTGFLDGTSFLKGLTRNLSFVVRGRTQTGTSITIPRITDLGEFEDSFIQFVNKNNDQREVGKTSGSTQSIVRGIAMEFELDIIENAKIKIVTDPEFGSFMEGRGTGYLQMEIDTRGDFNMRGDFRASEGFYTFKYLGIVDKDFQLLPGSSIVWDGDPLDAQIDLDAVYSVPGGANPTVLLDSPSLNQKIPTNVNIQLQGNLQRPDNPMFEIEFPNVSGVVLSEINYTLTDPQTRQLQALSLLSQGIFVRDVGVTVAGITNNLFQTFSDVLSNLLGEEDDKLKMGVNYLQGDKSQIFDFTTADRLGVTLSTQISDRILINGNIGVPVGGFVQSYIIGDLQIDFILNKQGTLKANIFNRENELRFIGDELGYTQGIGISYNVDFDSFGELIRKIISSQHINF